ncbi:MAG TPA: ABC transporter permease [Acidimicrobiales bacterium]
MTALALVGGSRSLRVVERNVRSYLRMWPAFVSGFVEPVFYLLSIGIGVGALVGDVPGPGGTPIRYEQFVAPAMMATAAMNGAVFDATYNFFFKFKYAKTFDGMLATPLNVHDVVRGELLWSLLRGTIYAVAFLVTMWALGLTPSAWSVLTVPTVMLIGFAFAGAGLAFTTFLRSFTDFDWINLTIMPLMLFSATFFPIDRYPDAVGALVRLSPLYQGVAIQRGLVLGELSGWLLVHAAYLAAMGWLGLRVAGRRLGRLLQP